MSISLAIALVFGAASYHAAQSSEIPCPRNQPEIAYHAKERAIFLFGGYCGRENTRLNDLWRFDGAKWTQVQQDDPPAARSGHELIYDRRNRRLVLFGGKGNDGKLLADTWVWKNGNWKLISETGPPARQSHELAYDGKTGRIYLFGGSDAARKSFDDTWVFSKDRWRKIDVEASPPARLQHKMAFDERRRKLVLFGGFDRADSGKVVFGDTWEFDGSEWTKRDDSPELARDHHAIVYDRTSKRVLIFGGYKDRKYLGDTRKWERNGWRLMTEQGPTPRAGKPGFVFGKNFGGAVLFGGGNSENMTLMDFWRLESRTGKWTALSLPASGK